MIQRENLGWYKSLALSIGIHLFCLLIFFVGFTSLFQVADPDVDILSFDIVTISDINNLENQVKSIKQKNALEKSKSVTKTQLSKNDIKQNQEKADKKLTDPKNEKIDPIEEKTKTQEEKVQANKNTAQPKSKETELSAVSKDKNPDVKLAKNEKLRESVKKQPVEKNKNIDQKPTNKVVTQNTKQVKKQEQDVIGSILKNLEKDSIGDDHKNKNQHGANTENQDQKNTSQNKNYNPDKPLSITEKLLIKNQIQKHWRLPAGSHNLDKVVVILHIELDKDASLASVSVKQSVCPNGSVDCNLAEESTLRAVRASSPFTKLSLERYEIWKEFDLEFDASFFAR